jgi:hypothetical protein
VELYLHFLICLHSIALINKGAFTASQFSTVSKYTRISHSHSALLKIWLLTTLTKQKIISNFVGFEVFTALVMKSIIFWDMTQCSQLSFNRRFGGTYRLHLQGRRNRFSKPANKQVASFCFFDPEDRGDVFFRNVG